MLVQFHEDATRFRDLEALANGLFQHADELEAAAQVEASRATDGAGGWFVKAFTIEGQALGLLRVGL